MPTTKRPPMKYDAYNLANGNSFFTIVDGTNFDYGVVRFLDAVTGIGWWTCPIPPDLAPTPNWNLALVCKPATGAGGNGIFTVRGRVVTNGGAYDGAMTTLLSSAAIAIDQATDLTIVTLGGASFDATLAIAANQFLTIAFEREGGVVADTLGASFDVKDLLLIHDVA